MTSSGTTSQTDFMQISDTNIPQRFLKKTERKPMPAIIQKASTSVTTSNRKRTTASAYRPESVPVPGGKVPTGNSIAMMPPSMWSSDPAK